MRSVVTSVHQSVTTCRIGEGRDAQVTPHIVQDNAAVLQPHADHVQSGGACQGTHRTPPASQQHACERNIIRYACNFMRVQPHASATSCVRNIIRAQHQACATSCLRNIIRVQHHASATSYECNIMQAQHHASATLCMRNIIRAQHHACATSYADDV